MTVHKRVEDVAFDGFVEDYGVNCVRYAWGWWNGYQAASGKKPTAKQLKRVLDRCRCREAKQNE